MPYYTIPAFPHLLTNAGIGFTTQTMSASGHRVAYVFQAPRTGTLNRVGFRTGAVSNNPDNGIRVSFQDVNSSGDPDLTQDQYRDVTGTINANTWFLTGLMTNNGTDGGTKRSVTRGEVLAIVFDFVSFVASDNLTIAGRTTVTAGGPNMPYVSTYNGTSWAKANNAVPIFGLEYDDGVFYEVSPYVEPAQSLTTVTFNSGSTPDEYALRFIPDKDRSVAGAYLMVDLDNAADVVLYDSGGSALATATVPAGVRRSTTPQWMPVWFSSSVNLTGGETYYLAVKPTTTSDVSVYTVSVPSASYMTAMPAGNAWYLATRTNAGAWSTTTTDRPYFHLILDDDGGGAPTPTGYTIAPRLVGPGGLV